MNELFEMMKKQNLAVALVQSNGVEVIWLQLDDADGMVVELVPNYGFGSIADTYYGKIIDKSDSWEDLI